MPCLASVLDKAVSDDYNDVKDWISGQGVPFGLPHMEEVPHVGVSLGFHEGRVPGGDIAETDFRREKGNRSIRRLGGY